MTMEKQRNSDFGIYSSKYSETIWSILLFEIKSFIGRTFLDKKPQGQKGAQLLNLGCGLTIIKGWVNADFYNGVLPWNYWKVRKMWMQDFRYGLNCPSNYWDGVFTEHTLEHLHPNEVINLLKEIHRTLKKGKWLRISVPDLEQFVKFYNKNSNKEFKKNWGSGAEAIWSLTQNWGHHSVWDFDLLKSFLMKSGFKNVKKVGYRRGTDKNIIMDEKSRKFGSLYIEAQK
jgi:predicted SAM-dependent methyltransferase